ISASGAVRRAHPTAPGTASCRSCPDRSAHPLPRRRGSLLGGRSRAPWTALQASDGLASFSFLGPQKSPTGTRPNGLVAPSVVAAGNQLSAYPPELLISTTA